MKEAKEIAFSISEISLQDAQNVVAAGEGKYSDLLITLCQKLPIIELNNLNIPASERKAISFGVPGGKEIDEKDRRGLCHMVNIGLRRSGIMWKIHYSGNRKLFICVPRKDKINEIKFKPVKTSAPEVGSAWNTTNSKKNIVLEMKERGLSANNIARKLDAPLSAVNYYYYPRERLRLERKQVPVPILSGPLKSPLSPEDFLSFARTVLNFRGEIKEASQECALFKKALGVVCKEVGIPRNTMGLYIGLKHGSMSWIVHHSRRDATGRINLLRQALKKEGVLS